MDDCQLCCGSTAQSIDRPNGGFYRKQADESFEHFAKNVICLFLASDLGS